MRRLAVGLVLGVLIFGTAFAGAKLANVTNPMQVTLDANGQDILHVNEVTFAGGSGIGFSPIPGTFGITASAIVINNGNTGLFRILTGSEDPSASSTPANPGSIYLRLANSDGVYTGELWFKTGNTPSAWTKVAG